MSPLPHSARGAALWVVLVAVATTSCATAPDAASPNGASGPVGAGVDSSVKGWLEKLDGFAEQGRVELTETIQQVDASGQHIELTNLCTIYFDLKGGRLYMDTRGDQGHITVWKDGKTVTRVDFAEDKNTYLQIEDPGALADLLGDDHHVFAGFPPIVGLLAGKPSERLMEGMTSGRHLGQHLVVDQPCEHIALQGDDAAIQVWLKQEDDGAVLLKKVVLGAASYPRWSSMSFLISTAKEQMGDDVFEAKVPDGAQRIQALPDSVVEASDRIL